MNKSLIKNMHSNSFFFSNNKKRNDKFNFNEKTQFLMKLKIFWSISTVKNIYTS